jgi:hypothetical protein
VVVFSNQRLGPSAELVVSNEVAAAMLQATADAIRTRVEARWEHELLRWLDERARAVGRLTTTETLDVGEIAWTRDHFDAQRWFLVDAIVRAAMHSEHASALERWRQMIEAHPKGSVQLARRWTWTSTIRNN